MSDMEKTCENCEYECEDMEGMHCRHCIHNAEEHFEPKIIRDNAQEIRVKAIDDMKSAWDSRVKDLIKWCKDKRLSGLEQADLIFDEIAEKMRGAE